MLTTIINQGFCSRLGWMIALGILFTSQEAAFAQVKPDSSLPSNSQVNQQGNIYNITGGTQAGTNLFHSFEKFGIPDGSEAYFNNAVDIQNIINRVTGKSISEINGLIRANGTANLFLINPNGIVFGENAQFDIGGSFIGSTASSFKFGDGKEFSAINPLDKPLLSVNVPLGLQYGKNPGNIAIKAKGDTQRNTIEIFEPKSGLQVPVNKTLALLGGDVLLEGATLKAASGRIELGSVTEGFISITPVEKGFAFGFDKFDNLNNLDNSDKFGEIRLSKNTAVDTTGDGAGDVRVTAKNVTIQDNSVIASTQEGTEKGGGIVINAIESIELTSKNNSFIPSGLYANNLSENVTQETGNILLNTQNLTVRDGATITTNAYRAGKGGNINIKASNLRIESRGTIKANTFSSGNGGNLNVDAADVQVVGVGDNPSFIGVKAEAGSTGNTGNLNITTNNLLVKDGATIFTNTSAEGDGGDMIINATSKIELIGQNSELLVVGERPSTGDTGSLTIDTKRMLVQDGVLVSVSNNASGSAGDLNITTDHLLIQDNVSFRTGRVSEGEVSGDLSIKTNRLLVAGGSTVEVGTSGEGGNLNIDAQDVQVIGTGNNGNTPSSLNLSASRGNKGSINLNTKRLLIKDGASVSTGTSNAGDGGNLIINAEDVQIVGKGGNNSENKPYPSGIFAPTEASSSGNAGNLIINAKRMLVQDGAFVTSASNGKGNGGDLVINADSLQVQGESEIISGASSEGTGRNLQITANNLLVEDKAKIGSDTSGTGNAGNLTINSDTIRIRDKAEVTVESEGTGNAGILTLNARSISLDNEALLNASTQSADSNNEQATININNARDLILRRGSNITTNAKGKNVRGGNINIDSDIVAAIGNENSDISANSENFQGGNIKIEAQGIFGTQFREESTFRSDITATGASQDLSGTVEINTPDINPNNELTELPSTPINSKLVQGCYSPGYAQNKFFIVGRGGLPILPEDFLTPSAVRVDWVTPQSNNENSLSARNIQVKTTTDSKPIVEATGWIVNQKGEIIFTADALAKADNSMQQAKKCELVR